MYYCFSSRKYPGTYMSGESLPRLQREAGGAGRQEQQEGAHQRQLQWDAAPQNASSARVAFWRQNSAAHKQPSQTPGAHPVGPLGRM